MRTPAPQVPKRANKASETHIHAGLLLRPLPPVQRCKMLLLLYLLLPAAACKGGVQPESGC
jgi:hypothetical protein